MSVKGLVFNIQRHSIHDGPGIRTILFLKGCPMYCWWCSNPESQAVTPELSFEPSKCIGCDACLKVCPSGAIKKDTAAAAQGPQALSFNRAACTNCGACAEVCYANARTREGREMGVEEAITEIMKDELFFRRSGGGLTLGGGEPLIQAQFGAAVLEGVRSRGLSTAIETAGHVLWENFCLVYPHTDYFLYDIKHTDPEKHKHFTGVDTSLIQENLKKLLTVHSRVIARVPVVPGFNDSEEELLAIADYTAKSGITEINLLPYHGYGSAKYGLLGKTYPMKSLGQLPGTNEITGQLEKLKEAIGSRGLKVKIGG